MLVASKKHPLCPGKGGVILLRPFDPSSRTSVMDAARQLIRYSIPGGVFAVLLILFDLIFHAFWHSKPNVTFFAVTGSGFATAAGIIILGFIIYQFYYAMHQPIVRFPFPRIKLGRTYDRAGWILTGLTDVDGFLERVKEMQGITGPLDYIDRYFDDPRTERSRFATTIYAFRNHERDKEYTERWYINVHAMRSLINITTSDGQTRIKDDYVALGDIYHALGACRISIGLSLFVTGIQYIVVDYSQYSAHLVVASTCAAAACVIIVGFMLRIVQHNRQDTLHTMKRQLRRDLRSWIAQHPDFLLPQRDSLQGTVARGGNSGNWG
jgi:hypothetical protein